MAEVPRAGVEEVDEAVASAKAAFPAWRAVAPGDRLAAAPCSRRRLEAPRGELAVLEARNAGKPIADARGEMAMVVETFRYYAGAPERLLGQTIPVAGGVDMTFREPLGVVGLIVPWNFPLVDRLLEDCPGARGGQHGRPQAGGADPADGRSSSSGSRSRRGSRRACSTSSPGPARSAASGWWSTPTSPRSPSPARPRSGAGIAAGRRGHDQARHARARRQVGERGLRRRRPRGRGGGGAVRGVRQRRPGLLRPLADPRRALRVDDFIARSRSTVRDRASATRSTRRRRWVR